jgi:hypothetical protein
MVKVSEVGSLPRKETSMRSRLLVLVTAPATLVGALALSGCRVDVADSDGTAVEAETNLELSVMKPPIGKCQPGDVGCDGIPDVPACAGSGERCFGAVGMGCSGDGIGVVPSESFSQVGCQGNVCWVNAGSWLHDQCCAASPTGRWCHGPLSAFNAACTGVWDTATHRYNHNLGWKRTLDLCKSSSSGTVVFADYCAPGDTIVAQPDGIRCCGRMTRPFVASSDAALARNQGVRLDGSFVPVVCVGELPPPPPPPPVPPVWRPETARHCTSGSQCVSGEACVTYPNIVGKICVPM